MFCPEQAIIYFLSILGPCVQKPNAISPEITPPLDWRQAHWPPAGNSEQAKAARISWRDAAQTQAQPEARAFALALLEDKQGLKLLDGLMGNSPFLRDVMLREIPFMRRLLRAPLRHTLNEILSAVQKASVETIGDAAALMQALRRLRQQAALTIALADIGQLWPLDSVMRAYSDFADACIRASLKHVLAQASQDGWLQLKEKEDCEEGCGLLVLAVGKLGSRELNFSSDIDLIVFFDERASALQNIPDLQRKMVRLTQNFSDILSQRTAAGYVFRTDLRLRPDPNATPLCISLASAEQYYLSQGLTWERAAMIRARCVAGDSMAAERFMDFIGRFIWRRSLDFAALEDIRAIKQQIQAHKGGTQNTLNGHDIKTGSGGIREIEFFVQTQQLIFGGRDTALRTGHILTGLQKLQAAKHIHHKVKDELTESYLFLRRIEHRLQMLEDQQRYHLPHTETGMAEIACFLGYHDPGLLRDTLWFHRQRVQAHYATLFEDAARQTDIGTLVFTGVDEDPATLDTLRQIGFQDASAALARIRGWLSSRVRALRSEKQRQALLQILPQLLKHFGRTSMADSALAQFDDLLSRLPPEAALFSQLRARPALLLWLAEMFGSAPHLAQRLQTRPGLIEILLFPDTHGQMPNWPDMATHLAREMTEAAELEDRIRRLQNWKDDYHFAIGVGVLLGWAGANQGRELLSRMAEASLQTLLSEHLIKAKEKYGDFPNSAVALLAFGKLGAESMTLRSDLDIILIYKDQPIDALSSGPRALPAGQYYTRLTQALVNSLTAQTGHGAFYAVDMRLRPSGNSGPLATSLQSFMQYQQNLAWSWEHMALTRARTVAGDASLQTEISNFMQRLLTSPRPINPLRQDVLDMRQKILDEIKPASIWDFKHQRGGVVDLDFLAQYLLLRHAAKHPDLLHKDPSDLFICAAQFGILPQDIANWLANTYRLWRQLVGWLAVTNGNQFNASNATPAQAKQILSIWQETLREEEPEEILDIKDIEIKIMERQNQSFLIWQKLMIDDAVSK